MGVAGALAVLGMFLVALGKDPQPSVVPFTPLPVEVAQVEAFRLGSALAPLRIELERVPDAVELDGTLRVVLVVANPSPEPVALEPCPLFVVGFGESGTGTYFAGRLPCDAVSDEIGSGEAARFWIELPVLAEYGFRSGFTAPVQARLGGWPPIRPERHQRVSSHEVGVTAP